MNTLIYWWLLIFWPGYNDAHTKMSHRCNGFIWAADALAEGFSIEEIRAMLDLDNEFDHAADLYLDQIEYGVYENVDAA